MDCNRCGKQLHKNEVICSACGTLAYERGQGKTGFSGSKDAAIHDMVWDVHGFPDNGPRKTEDINFDWGTGSEFPKVPDIENINKKTGSPKVSVDSETAGAATELLDSNENFTTDSAVTEEAKRQAQEIDKFFTINEKNEEFQKLLDREYEKISEGNVLKEGRSFKYSAEERKPVQGADSINDELEEMFAAQGLSTNVPSAPREPELKPDPEFELKMKLMQQQDEKKAQEEIYSAEAAPVINEASRVMADGTDDKEISVIGTAAQRESEKDKQGNPVDAAYEQPKADDEEQARLAREAEKRAMRAYEAEKETRRALEREMREKAEAEEAQAKREREAEANAKAEAVEKARRARNMKDVTKTGAENKAADNDLFSAMPTIMPLGAEEKAKAEKEKRRAEEFAEMERQHEKARLEREAHARAAREAEARIKAEMEARRIRKEKEKALEDEQIRIAQAAEEKAAISAERKEADPSSHISEMAKAREKFFTGTGADIDRDNEKDDILDADIDVAEEAALGRGRRITPKKTAGTAISEGITPEGLNDDDLAINDAEEAFGENSKKDSVNSDAKENKAAGGWQWPERPVEKVGAAAVAYGSDKSIEDKSGLIADRDVSKKVDFADSIVAGKEKGLGEEKNKSKGKGKGRTILNVIIIILVVLLLCELGIVAIKYFMPNSAASSAIDNVAVKVVQWFNDLF